MATRISPVQGPSGYVLVPQRESADFTLYRGRKLDDPSLILAIALATERPSPKSIRRLDHEYSFVGGQTQSRVGGQASAITSAKDRELVADYRPYIREWMRRE